MYGYGYGYGMDTAYMLVIIVSIVLGMLTQGYIQSKYRKWSGVPASSGLTGAQMAQRMLESQGVYDVGIVPIGGRLTDNYDPRSNKLSLSRDNMSGGSVASVAVACHEAGHALQNAKGYGPMKFRSMLVPVVSIASNTWMLAFFAGMVFNMAGLVQVALIMFAASVLFQLVTLPVEFDASGRAVNYLESAGMSAEALAGAKEVLTAAALTYVASALVSVMQFVYLYSRSDRN